MPLKDLSGSPPPTVQERMAIKEMWKRYGPSLPNWLTSRKDDGGEMAPLPSGPKPTPMVGGAEVTSE